MRRSRLISVLVAIIVQGSEAQGTFPLQHGNLWQFASNYPDSVRPETRVLGDTTLPNGIQYVSYRSRFLGLPYMRQVGSAVYSFNTSTSQDFKLFDFSLGPADTVSKRVQFSQQFVITVVDTGRVSTNLPDWLAFEGQRYWIFDDNLMIGPSSGYSFARHVVIDSIGIVFMEGEPGYYWILTGARIDGEVRYGVINALRPSASIIPRGLRLAQNYPNPFNPATTINFELATAEEVDLSVFNILGSKVETLVRDHLPAGRHSITWDASMMATGTYICRLKGRTQTLTRRMYLIK